eukprot:TRINITY_DN12837_c0_g1_i1.p1 TRINITY_DN12837_c0_g1~~TRINITY_DN12837_c0_g1_i1.p1  ORF type:complete len:339 (+),score=59.52 TRINITY_DN12837_c0_g1_i1:148-1017(+)
MRASSCPFYSSSSESHRPSEILYQWQKLTSSSIPPVLASEGCVRACFGDYRTCAYFVSLLLEDPSSELSSRLMGLCLRYGTVIHPPPLAYHLKPCCGGDQHDHTQEPPSTLIYGHVHEASPVCRHYVMWPSELIPHHHSPSSDTSATLSLVHLHVGSVPSQCIEADLAWSYKIELLLQRHGFLVTQSLVNTTLGGAYACLKDAKRAAFFALRQLQVSLLLGDEPMEIRSRVYLAYWFIYKEQYGRARYIVQQQNKRACRLGMRSLIVMTEAALIFLRKTRYAARKRTIK